MGGRAPGVPRGVAGVRLSKFYHQEQVSKLRTIKILDSTVSIALHIPKRKQSANDYQSKEAQYVTTRPRSFTWKDVTATASWPVSETESTNKDATPHSEYFAPEPKQRQRNTFTCTTTTALEFSQFEELPGRSRTTSTDGVSESPSNESRSPVGDHQNWGEGQVGRNTQTPQRDRTTVSVSEQTLLGPNIQVEEGLLAAQDILKATFPTLYGPSLKREVVINFYAFPGHL